MEYGKLKPEDGNDNPEVRNQSSRHAVFLSPVLWARLILGGIFIFASVDKIVHPGAFAQVIRNYGILPDILVNLTAVVLPWLELFVGIALVAGFQLPGAAVICETLLLVFWGALVFNIARGVDVHCGCFSTNVSGKPHTLWYLFRDTVFLAVGGYLLYNVCKALVRENATARR